MAYQTEKLTVPFLVQSVEDIIRSFNLMFLLKDTLNKANTFLRLSKLHFKDRTIQKHGEDVDPVISVKMEITDLKKNGKGSDQQV